MYARVNRICLAILLGSMFIVTMVSGFAFVPVHTASASRLPVDSSHGSGGGHKGGGGGFSCPVISGADSSVCSTNWSGYADTGSKGSVTHVAGSWTVPSLTCSSSGTQYVAVWVGIDGYSSSTVEQTGIMGECSNGAASYFAWYEFYPNPSVTISGFTVKAGDSITATVSSYGSGEFTTTITDGSESYSASGTVTNAAMSSAEWIVERPALCIGAHCTLTTLANFGSTTFTSASATVGGKTGSLSSFTDVAITMVASRSGPILAQPTSLSPDGSSFTDNYG